MLFSTNYLVPRQIKPRILRVSIRRGQSNRNTVLILIAAAITVSLEQVGFDCHSHAGADALSKKDGRNLLFANHAIRIVTHQLQFSRALYMYLIKGELLKARVFFLSQTTPYLFHASSNLFACFKLSSRCKMAGKSSILQFFISDIQKFIPSGLLSCVNVNITITTCVMNKQPSKY